MPGLFVPIPDMVFPREPRAPGQVPRRMTLAAGFQLERSILVAAFVVLGAGAGQAQPLPLTLPAGQSRATVKATTRADPTPPVDPRHPANPLYPSQPYPGTRYPAYPVAMTYIPAILMSDGTVWADFGSGYVRVVRSCREPRIIDSRGMPKSRSQTTSCYMRDAYGSLVVTR